LGTRRERDPTAPATANDTAVERLDTLVELRAAAELRETFGNVAEARDVLNRLAMLLDRLDSEDQPDKTNVPNAKAARRRTSS